MRAPHRVGGGRAETRARLPASGTTATGSRDATQATRPTRFTRGGQGPAHLLEEALVASCARSSTRNPEDSEVTVAIDIDTLKAERDRLTAALREVEAGQRRVEAELKTFRQREIQTKREIEALTVLIDVNEARDQEERSGE